jgi:hypothetical protein
MELKHTRLCSKGMAADDCFQSLRLDLRIVVFLVDHIDLGPYCEIHIIICPLKTCKTLISSCDWNNVELWHSTFLPKEGFARLLANHADQWVAFLPDIQYHKESLGWLRDVINFNSLNRLLMGSRT